jgi:hypothetical protein
MYDKKNIKELTPRKKKRERIAASAKTHES